MIPGTYNTCTYVRTYLIREAELSGDGGQVGRHETLVGEQQHHNRGEQNQREVFRAAFSPQHRHTAATPAAAARAANSEHAISTAAEAHSRRSRGTSGAEREPDTKHKTPML